MVVKIRLARFGRRKAPFYNIVVAHARFVKLLMRIGECTDGGRTARNSKPIEVLGMPRIPIQDLCRYISANMDSARNI
jgi:small subunit ribosomal protein S16